jgi:hypothetical protein
MVEREGSAKPIEFSLIRSTIEVESVLGHKRTDKDAWSYVIDPENKICYVRLTQFSENTYGELEKVMKQLAKDGIKGFILDLRFNPGGLLDSSIKISDLFIDDGMIVTIRHRDGASFNSSMVRLIAACQPGVERQAAGANPQQEQRAQQHRPVGPRLMGHGPESAFKQNRDLRRADGDNHDGDRGKDCQARQQSEDDEETAGNLEDADEWGRKLWRRDANLAEAAGSNGFDIQEFLNALGKENCPHYKTNQNHGGGDIRAHHAIEEVHPSLHHAAAADQSAEALQTTHILNYTSAPGAPCLCGPSRRNLNPVVPSRFMRPLRL